MIPGMTALACSQHLLFIAVRPLTAGDRIGTKYTQTCSPMLCNILLYRILLSFVYYISSNCLFIKFQSFVSFSCSTT